MIPDDKLSKHPPLNLYSSSVYDPVYKKYLDLKIQMDNTPRKFLKSQNGINPGRSYSTM